eukprot:TRINITY_DN10782_c0_g1_i8.p1 TRINITY_DN10782_c0_g1~~TRINITY_DN10782_c0_g1_i8.p1  ORF type:complete len:173 (-),score=58.02 TRINITY_DN10782_c0_g1_i8:99-617(-)
MLEFIRRKPIESFREITFEVSSQRQVGEDKDLDVSGHRNLCMDHSEEEKQPPANRKNEELKQSTEEAKEEEVKGNQRGSQRYMPTQSKVITGALKGSKMAMMKLMRNLGKDLQGHGEAIQSDPNAAGYWAYIYNSAVYLQQIINDVTVAHDSTLTFMQQEAKAYFGQSDNIV